MSYMALYRKFRPQTFEQVKGQDHVVRTLKNQIKNNRIGHAYLFTGTRGTGKTSVAKLFAKAINCLEPVDGEPCNHCETCLAAAKDSFMDIVEIDAASNTGVDDIRRIIEEVRYTPVKGRYKVYIIDEVHMLSGSAFNAFLKTLEEPPSYAVFILATTEPHKLPITILSRCQRYDFHRIESATIAANLKELTDKEGVEAEEKALAYIARAGDGSMRDSISLLDKCIAFSLGEKLTYENVLQTLGAADTDIFSKVFRAVHGADASAALAELEKTANSGRDISQFVSDFIWYLRNILLLNAGSSNEEDLLGVSEENLKTLKEDAKIADSETLMRYIRILSKLQADMRFSMSKQILAEVAFIKLARPQMESDPGSLADRIRQLEGKVAQLSASPAAAVSPGIPQMAANVPNRFPEPDSSIIIGQDEEWYEPEIPAEQPVFEQDFPAAETGTDAPQPDRMISASWGDIVSACEGRILKMALKKSELQEDDEGHVTIYTPEGVNLDTVKNSVKEVEMLIEKVTGKPCHAAVRALGSKAADPFPEDLLRNINFDIGTEDI